MHFRTSLKLKKDIIMTSGNNVFEKCLDTTENKNDLTKKFKNNDN